jgi:hypothetical protein
LKDFVEKYFINDEFHSNIIKQVKCIDISESLSLEIKKIIEQEENSKDQMSGELYKDESGLWVIWYWKEDEESFEGGKIPLHPDLQKKMEGLNFIENLIEGGEVDFLIVRDNKLCEEFMTYDYAKIVSSKKGE